MSKVLFIGDVHTKVWIVDKIKEILIKDRENKNEIDKIIFVGDYLDEWNATLKSNTTILNKMLALKNEYNDKVILLLGNHELSYLGYPCSGFNCNDDVIINLSENIKLFDLIYEEEHFIVTHAGITSNWLEIAANKLQLPNNLDARQVIQHIKELFNDRPKELLYLLSIASYTSGSYNDIASPLWSRPLDHSDYLLNYKTQIVGHTPVNEIIKVIHNNCPIYYIDTFSTYKDFRPIGDDSILIYDRTTQEYFKRRLIEYEV